MELLHEFGVDPILFGAQIVNFLIVFYILKRFLYKPILTMLKNREETIKRGLQEAEEARVLLEKAEEKEKKILRSAQDETKKLLEQARAQRMELIKEARALAKAEADTIYREAREQIAFETRQAEKRLSAHVSRLAVQFLERSLSNLVSEKDQESIMKNALTKIKKKVD